MFPFRRNPSQSPLLKIVSFCVVLISISFSACATSSSQTQPLSSHAQPTSTKSIRATATVSPASTPAAAQLLRPDFERGMIYPGWSQNSYGTTDTTWQQGIQTIKTQTMATWLEIPVLFTQSTPYSTDAGPGANTPNLTAFAGGIRKAHALGYHVFFIPLMGVNTPGGWSGIIQLETQQQQQAWFANYWNTLKPYAVVAQENGVEQMSIGTELQWLEQNAPASLWETLIAQVHGVFHGTLTYDMNWPSLYLPPVSWLKNPDLTMIGVSEYISLIDTSEWIAPSAMPGLWKSKVGTFIDAFSKQIGKPVLISEIGYRNTSDTLYNPWDAQSSAPVDSAAQAAAYDATLSNAFADSRIAGIFFWGWAEVARLDIQGQAAVQVVHKWYTMTGK